jgi:hypothetical protein
VRLILCQGKVKKAVEWSVLLCKNLGLLLYLYCFYVDLFSFAALCFKLFVLICSASLFELAKMGLFNWQQNAGVSGIHYFP